MNSGLLNRNALWRNPANKTTNLHAVMVTALMIALFCAVPVIAAEDPDAPKPEVLYYDLDPNIITNYQKPPSRRLGFVTVDIQIQVSSESSLDLLERHKPLVEDTLIDVINAQTEDDIKNIEHRNKIRGVIKSRLASVLKEETGQELVDEIWFTKFIYQ